MTAVDERGAGSEAEQRTPLLRARNLVQEFPVRTAGGVRGGVVHAVSNVSFDVYPGETLGVVGETGSGKSTLARSVIQAPRPKSGSVEFQGTDLMTLHRRDLKQARRQMQMVYQDPFGSLNPRWRVNELVEEPLLGYGAGDAGTRKRRVEELLDLVGLDPSVYGKRRPFELSGGQCQRVAIARAIALDPALVIQAQVLNLFEKLRRELKLSYLFIAHDLAMVKQVSDRVAVMYLGQLAEIGPAEGIYRQPVHPYTAALLDSIPSIDPATGRARKPTALPGEPPSPVDPPSGCRFRTRCPRAQLKCAEEEPQLVERLPGHFAARRAARRPHRAPARPADEHQAQRRRLPRGGRRAARPAVRDDDGPDPDQAEHRPPGAAGDARGAARRLRRRRGRGGRLRLVQRLRRRRRAAAGGGGHPGRGHLQRRLPGERRRDGEPAGHAGLRLRDHAAPGGQPVPRRGAGAGRAGAA
jgi:oligopeptide/dipeptide ABC transporter ATP-binding protein